MCYKIFIKNVKFIIFFASEVSFLSNNKYSIVNIITYTKVLEIKFRFDIFINLKDNINATRFDIVYNAIIPNFPIYLFVIKVINNDIMTATINNIKFTLSPSYSSNIISYFFKIQHIC